MTAPLGAAQALATLIAIISDQPDRPDPRPTAELEHEAAMEQRAEDRAAARRGDHDGETSREWLARKRAG